MPVRLQRYCFLAACLALGGAAAEEGNGTEANRTKRSRVRAKCAPELNWVTEKETSLNFARRALTYCNASSPWAAANTRLPRVLGFVAPWNEYSYKASRHFRGKFTHVSPLWFRILPAQQADDDPGKPSLGAFEIAGQQQAEKKADWTRQMGATFCRDGSCGLGPSVLPHFSLEGFAKLDALKALLKKPTALAEEIAAVCQYGKYAGIVFDVRLALFSAVKPLLPGLLEALSKELRSYNKLLYISAPAAVPGPKAPAFDTEDAAAAAPFVEGLILGTRDFARSEFGPSAPLPWIRSSAKRLLRGFPAEKLLIEIPVYGRAFPEQGSQEGTVVLAKELAKSFAKEQPELTWDAEAEEHEATMARGSTRVSVPTLQYVAARLQLAKALGVGVAIRELGAGLDYAFDLLPDRGDLDDELAAPTKSEL